MRRPWYTYILLFVGGIALLGAAFRPMVGALTQDPGGVSKGPTKELVVREGSPMSRAGIRSGDRFESSETIELGGDENDPERPLRWTRDIPQSGQVAFSRGGRTLSLDVRPEPPAWPVSLAWSVTGLLNFCLAVLALALFWQRAWDPSSVLLGMVLMSAPVFAFPQEPRLLPLVLAAHFFRIFPPRAQAQATRWRRFWRTSTLYLPFLILGFLGLAMWGDSRGAARVLFDLLALGYAGYGLVTVRRKVKDADAAERPVIRTLTVAAIAILAAVILGTSRSPWVISDQFVPANLLPAALFSAAVARLVFGLRALEIRVIARRTLQYLLARWTLGTLFLIPGFLLVWRFGQLSVLQQEGKPGDVLPYLVWMFVAALLLRKRQSVLRNVDRRFFRDAEATRQALVRLAQDIGRQVEAHAVVSTLETGVREALHPEFAAFVLPDQPEPAGAVLAVPVRRGETLLGCLHLGPRETGEAYTAEEMGLLDAVGAQTAVALENSRLSAALLARQRAELEARTAGVLSGTEEERRRLAADLHDQVLPELRQIAGEVALLKGRSNGLTPDLERLEADVRASMDSVREVMEALRPSALDMLGLGDALESYLRRSAARAAPPVTVSVRRSGEEPPLSPDASLGLYRICQEAINNALKHAGASRIELDVRGDTAGLSLALSDDGRGLDLAAAEGRGRGLSNIRHRADLIGASVRWSPQIGGGTRFEADLSCPYSAATNPARGCRSGETGTP